MSRRGAGEQEENYWHARKQELVYKGKRGKKENLAASAAAAAKM